MQLSYLEDLDSQIPAIEVLHGLGWDYLSRDEAVKLRGGRLDRVVLTEVLKSWLCDNNRIETRGDIHPFTEVNISEAVRRLTDEPFDGLARTNEKIYHLLTLGISLDQTIDGDRKGRSLHYINWQRPEKNVYHLCDEFIVERSRSRETARPDLVLFVNGIPFVVIECKRRDKDGHKDVGQRQIDAAIKQQLRNQEDNWIPQLFVYAQMLIATSVNEVLYGTIKTPRKFWSKWREGGDHEAAVHIAANRRLSATVEEKLFAAREQKQQVAYQQARDYFTELRAAGERLPTEQDRTLWALLRPERLLDLIYGYSVFDAGVRKIARYQQYFIVKRTVERVTPLHEGKRRGGVIWHTTGSGKSLSMVMLAKALALHPAIVDPRVIIVTDRIDLDDQIWETFEACGKSAAKAKTGEHLMRLLTDSKTSIITTIINKFKTVKGKFGVKIDNSNIFVLIDESHRSNYGETAAQMRRVFPNACYLGFTGTPLLKKEKETARKFGGFIRPFYSMRQAVEDNAVVRLLYEGRLAKLEQNRESMQSWFERITARLSDAQKADLKRKMVGDNAIHKAGERLKMIAFDAGLHYAENFQDTGFKAQLAADSRTSAIRLRKFFQEFDMVEAEVVMSKPELRVSRDEEPEEDPAMVARFWDEMLERFGSEEQYVKGLLASFGRADGVEILIVVEKLLTGFDEPRNTVLYIDRPLQDHTILQAIARVNRIFPGKDFGYIVDYRGVLGKLNEAIDTYDALSEFDGEDIDMTGAVIDTHAEISLLPQRHSDLWAVFKEVANKQDTEAIERYLEPPDTREEFYAVLRTFQKTLTVALATEHFYDDVPPERIRIYKEDLKFFYGLRNSVQHRYSETIDYSQYETQIRKLMDSHIQSPDVELVTDLVDIFDVEAFDNEIEKVFGTAAKADTIASRTVRTIHEKMDEDPVFYRKFADLVQQAIDDYRQHRISDTEYLHQVREHQEAVRRGHASDLPEELNRYQEAPAYYGIVSETLSDYGTSDKRREIATKAAITIEKIIAQKKIRDWSRMEDVVKAMQNDIDDYLFDIRSELDLSLSTADMDAIIERCIAIAKKQVEH